MGILNPLLSVLHLLKINRIAEVCPLNWFMNVACFYCFAGSNFGGISGVCCLLLCPGELGQTCGVSAICLELVMMCNGFCGITGF